MSIKQQPMTYEQAFKEFGAGLVDRVRELDELERQGVVHRSEADKILAGIIESQVYAIAQVVVKKRMAEYKKKYQTE